ncbi:hypothetical protein H4Q26_005352 [Puccinia striiformis f. sp. tritici PST-130]|nr:hypothetical protein H4Q26_005352 [Puccinia striiformis f. sp. tritici PST-130]
MSAITSTQPTQAKTTQQTATPAQGRGGRGGRRGGMHGGGRGGRAVRGGANHPTQTPGRTQAAPRSWTNDRNRDGLSSLNLIVEWITVEGRYDRWRNSTVSKCEVAEEINQFLIDNGGESRAWRGIEQHVTGLEKKFVRPWRGETKLAKASWTKLTSRPAKLVATLAILSTRTFGQRHHSNRSLHPKKMQILLRAQSTFGGPPQHP